MWLWTCRLITLRGCPQSLPKRDMLVPPEILLDILLQTKGDLPVNALHLHSRFKAELFTFVLGMNTDVLPFQGAVWSI